MQYVQGEYLSSKVHYFSEIGWDYTFARILRQWAQINFPRRPVLLFPITSRVFFNGLL
jgi:hypothetical protein